MKVGEDIQIEGRLNIDLVYPDGRNIKHFEDDNLITTLSKQFLLSGIYLPSIVSDQVTTLKVGTGGTVDPGGLYPLAEDPAATGLHTLLLSVPVVYVLDLPNVAVTFLADVDQSTGNGSSLSECAMFKASGLIFNLKNHPAITKTSEFSIHYSWTIRYL
jgi:hypothetical protein